MRYKRETTLNFKLHLRGWESIQLCTGHSWLGCYCYQDSHGLLIMAGYNGEVAQKRTQSELFTESI